MLQDNIKFTLKPVQTVKSITLTEEMACGLAGRERRGIGFFTFVLFMPQMYFVIDTLFSTNFFFPVEFGSRDIRF
jgi:hypothetical protein